MRDFTTEEKEKIVSTPITMECFDIDIELYGLSMIYSIKKYINTLNELRRFASKDNSVPDADRERYFTELVRLLPNSYKVVKL